MAFGEHKKVEDPLIPQAELLYDMAHEYTHAKAVKEIYHALSNAFQEGAFASLHVVGVGCKDFRDCAAQDGCKICTTCNSHYIKGIEQTSHSPITRRGNF